MSTVANLQAARAAIAIQSKWCTGKLLNPQGQMCALGALASVLSLPLKNHLNADNGDTYDRLAVTAEVNYLAEAAAKIRGLNADYHDSRVNLVYSVNDHTFPFRPEQHPDSPARQLTPVERHARVLKMFDEAIKIALADERLLP